MKDIKILIEKLIAYAEMHLDMEKIDTLYFRNYLLNYFGVSRPTSEKISFEELKDLKVPDSLILELKEYMEQNNFDNVERRITEILGTLSPLPSKVVSKVLELEKVNIGSGMDYLFNLEIKNDYIKKTAIEKNIYFKHSFVNNFLEITINLSKPEKKNSETAKLLIKSHEEKYPKCLLCEENLGYSGRDDHPARQNIRIVPVILDNEKWFIQYSPYAYFDHHIIVINSIHDNMSINNHTFIKLLDFVNQYPTYFIGSNADLPIVGGSILNHEHYQGGLHLLPVFYAKDKEIFYQDSKVKISHVDWYNSIIRIESVDKNEVINYARKIFNCWIGYDDNALSIISKDENGRHSTVTPIARKIGNLYQMNIILRNNRCDESYPDGIFHAHPEYHHIKSESIGLIEAMGLFILPPRLKRELGYISEGLTSNCNFESLVSKYPDVKKHEGMFNELVKKYGGQITEDKATEIINDYLANTCKNILINTAVFKDDTEGNKGLKRFMEVCLK